LTILEVKLKETITGTMLMVSGNFGGEFFAEEGFVNCPIPTTDILSDGTYWATVQRHKTTVGGKQVAKKYALRKRVMTLMYR
jgi:hypothetical protein